ncbi:sugar ABC transporter permease [Mycobacterium sp. KBS0706]|nr:sugar ABC transporter permease [Mycobacterium sp. KBS0706]
MAVAGIAAGPVLANRLPPREPGPDRDDRDPDLPAGLLLRDELLPVGPVRPVAELHRPVELSRHADQSGPAAVAEGPAGLLGPHHQHRGGGRHRRRRAGERAPARPAARPHAAAGAADDRAGRCRPQFPLAVQRPVRLGQRRAALSRPARGALAVRPPLGARLGDDRRHLAEHPLLVLLFLAGLQSLPQDPIEAAKVDGASPWAIFRYITLPLMRPVIMIALMLRIIDTFRTFDVIWLMTQGGPGGATNLITVNAYLLAFQGGAFGHAAAVSYIALFLSLLLLGVLYGAPRARRKLGRRS